MVRALKECWRVLKTGGWLIDLRPISKETPLSVVSGSRVDFAGLIDNSAVIPDDEIAQSYLQEVVSQGFFEQTGLDHFTVDQIWDSPKAFKAHTRQKWEKTLLPGQVYAEAERLAERLGPAAKVKLTLPMQITRYEKSEIHFG